mmetsp:Transcript_41958/g.121627  ORF Transcript_41958/g.121627 Transcript_41958/m.121627 type:complete len:297 (-) Transcript_41958:1168-2058(-)
MQVCPAGRRPGRRCVHSLHAPRPRHFVDASAAVWIRRHCQRRRRRLCARGAASRPNCLQALHRGRGGCRCSWHTCHLCGVCRVLGPNCAVQRRPRRLGRPVGRCWRRRRPRSFVVQQPGCSVVPQRDMGGSACGDGLVPRLAERGVAPASTSVGGGASTLVLCDGRDLWGRSRWRFLVSVQFDIGEVDSYIGNPLGVRLHPRFGRALGDFRAHHGPVALLGEHDGLHTRPCMAVVRDLPSGRFDNITGLRRAAKALTQLLSQGVEACIFPWRPRRQCRFACDEPVLPEPVARRVLA